ncbi:hypothetical protein GCM10028813_00340 [Ramlibacter alkalitolerans]
MPRRPAKLVRLFTDPLWVGELLAVAVLFHILATHGSWLLAPAVLTFLVSLVAYWRDWRAVELAVIPAWVVIGVIAFV